MVKAVSSPSELVVVSFHALSEPLRVKIIELLQENELCVCDLCEALDVAQSKLSFHLKTLKDAELVRSRQEGRAFLTATGLTFDQVMEAILVANPQVELREAQIDYLKGLATEANAQHIERL